MRLHDWEENKEAMRTCIERLFILRALAKKVDGFAIEDIDNFISSESKNFIEKFDCMSVPEIVIHAMEGLVKSIDKQ